MTTDGAIVIRSVVSSTCSPARAWKLGQVLGESVGDLVRMLVPIDRNSSRSMVPAGEPDIDRRRAPEVPPPVLALGLPGHDPHLVAMPRVLDDEFVRVSGAVTPVAQDGETVTETCPRTSA